MRPTNFLSGVPIGEFGVGSKRVMLKSLCVCFFFLTQVLVEIALEIALEIVFEIVGAKL